jgi:large-conductance mechanosensitive channel
VAISGTEGAAFTGIINLMVGDLFMPLIGALLG